MARIHGFLQNSTARIQMDSRTWSRISDPVIFNKLVIYCCPPKPLVAHLPQMETTFCGLSNSKCMQYHEEIKRIALILALYGCIRFYKMDMLKGVLHPRPVL